MCQNSRTMVLLEGREEVIHGPRASESDVGLCSNGPVSGRHGVGDMSIEKAFRLLACPHVNKLHWSRHGRETF
jgi:hypothetical protein